MDDIDVQILLVDDDELTNQIHETIIEVWSGGKVRTHAYSKAVEALEKLKSRAHSPRCIFLDLNMPDMDGWQFLEEYQKFDLGIPVFVLSSSIQEKDKEKAVSFPCVSSYVVKPLSPQTLDELGLDTSD